MKRLLLLAAALALGAGAAAAQNVPRPDCIIDITLTAAGQSAGGQGTCGNNINGVFEWRLNYKSIGFTALSLIIQSAPPDATGACTTATWVSFAGTIVSGVNPNTATTNGSTNVTGFYPCVRVFLTSKTGTGTITGQLYGCRQPGCSVSGASLSVTIPTPLPVDGPTAAGSPPTTPPVLVGGQDGAPGVIRTLKTDANGSLIPANASSADSDAVNNTEATATAAAGGILYLRVFNRVFNGTTWDRMRGNTSGLAPTNASSAAADGVSNTGLTPTDAAGANLYPRNEPMDFNGTTWDRHFVCTLSAPITFTAASGSLQIVGLVASQAIRVCHLSISTSAATSLTIQYGHGSNCGTGTTALSGAYNNVTTLALDLNGTLRVPASEALCISSSASITAGGMVTYAQF